MQQIKATVALKPEKVSGRQNVMASKDNKAASDRRQKSRQANKN